MSLPDYSMRQLLEAGVHFGHQAHRWNPKMGEFIFGTRNNIHIIDLAQSVPMLHQALQAVSDTVAKGGRILFVGTKRQAQDAVAEAAKRCAQYYVNSRWLGGTLTNWKTISGSISRLRKLDEMLASNEAQGYTKKERLDLTRERDKLDRSLGGIKDMGGVPDLLFVIDTNKEQLAIKEATRLGIPVAAIVDTNCNPDGITYVVPANDDAGRAIALYCDLIARAAIDGISRGQGASGVDLGASEEPMAEELNGILNWIEQLNEVDIEDVEALHVASAFDLKVPDRRKIEVQQLIAMINEQLWVGHFDLWSNDGMVMFRHSLVLAGGVEATSAQCQALLSSALESCEGYFPAFQFVVWAGKPAREALDAAMFQTSGEA